MKQQVLIIEQSREALELELIKHIKKGYVLVPKSKTSFRDQSKSRKSSEPQMIYSVIMRLK